jgi:hypothetical protein
MWESEVSTVRRYRGNLSPYGAFVSIYAAKIKRRSQVVSLDCGT